MIEWFVSVDDITTELYGPFKSLREAHKLAMEKVEEAAALDFPCTVRLLYLSRTWEVKDGTTKEIESGHD